jgi:hypothetical protein
MALREGGPLPQNGRRPRSGRVSDRETDPEILPGDHIPNRDVILIFMVDNQTKFHVEAVNLGSVRKHCVDLHVITHRT